MEKIIFSVEDIEVIQDPIKQFSKIKLKIARAGDNLHHLPIADNALDMAAPTLLKKPILCHIIKNGTAMGGHESGEQVVGFLDEQFFEEIDGEKWQCANALLWKIYFPDVISIFANAKDNSVSVSMEINVLEVSQNEKNETVIEKFEYTATTLIGVQPAIPEASATMVEFSKAVEEYEENKKLFGSQLTHFPKKGMNLPVHLNSSQYAEFDFDYATALKEEYPSVWSKGGNLRDNFAMWSKAHSEDNAPTTLDWIREREQWSKRHNRDKSPAGVVAQVKWGMVSDYGIESMKSTLEKEKEIHDAKNKAYFAGGEEMPYSKLSEINPSLKGIEPPISLGQANEIAKQADAIGADKGGWPEAIASFKKRYEVKDGHWVKKAEKMSEEFAKEDLGKGSALKVDKSKDKVSDTAWGSVNKTELEHKVLGASNYKSLVHDVYLIVDVGFEDKPSSSLHYPIMQLIGDTFVYNKGGLSAALGRARAQNESEVVSKVEGLYKKLGLGEDSNSNKEVKEKMADEEVKPKEEMVAPPEEKKETPEEVAKEKKEGETPAEEKKEGAEGEKKEGEAPAPKKAKMSEFCDLEKMAAFVADSEFAKEFAAEAAKEDDVDFGMVVKACYSAFCKMAEKFDASEKDKQAYMAKADELEKKFAEIEKQKFSMAVESLLKDKDISESLSKDEVEECRTDSMNFSLETISGWENKVKALAFTHTKGKKTENKVVTYALPFHDEPENTSHLLFK